MRMTRFAKLSIFILAMLPLMAGCGGADTSSDTALQEAQLAATQVALEATQAALAAPADPTDAPPPTDAPAVDPPADNAGDSQPPAADSGDAGSTEAEAFYVEDFDSDSVGLWTWYVFRGNEDKLAVYVMPAIWSLKSTTKTFGAISLMTNTPIATYRSIRAWKAW